MNYLRSLGKVFHNAFVKLLENALSKKFLVFAVATALLIQGHLPAEYWAAIASAVLGVFTAIDFKHGSKTFNEKPTNQPGSPAPGPTEIP